MNLIEAVNSGRPFRRAGTNLWIQMPHGATNALAFSRTEVLATDWETQKRKERLVMYVAQGLVGGQNFLPDKGPTTEVRTTRGYETWVRADPVISVEVEVE